MKRQILRHQRKSQVNAWKKKESLSSKEVKRDFSDLGCKPSLHNQVCVMLDLSDLIRETKVTRRIFFGGTFFADTSKKKEKRPCIECGKKHTNNNSFCSTTCCSLNNVN